jgi:integrase-like protein
MVSGAAASTLGIGSIGARSRLSTSCALFSAGSDLRSSFSNLMSCSPRTETRPGRRRSSAPVRAGGLCRDPRRRGGAAILRGACRPVFAAALYTGLRKGELFGLRKSDVDLEHRTITVRRSYDRPTTKGGHADAIPIAETLGAAP